MAEVIVWAARGYHRGLQQRVAMISILGRTSKWVSSPSAHAREYCLCIYVSRGMNLNGDLLRF